MPEKVTIGSATLYLGDAREVLPRLRHADALITDPPYGVEFKGKTTKHGSNVAAFPYRDDGANFSGAVLPIVRAAIALAERAAIFTGNRRLQEYPQAADIGGIFCPNGVGAGRWGWTCLHPVLFYGKRPSGAMYPSTRSIAHPGLRAEANDHPCPKPIAFMEWLVGLASNPGERVLDPFMGSGTTGVACAQLGRRFVGIEIEPRYFEIACRRIEAAHAEAKRARKAANDSQAKSVKAA